MTQDTTLHATTLTQLSSREQLSALMDGALPPDQTRYLLRRLQHDGYLKGSHADIDLAALGVTLQALIAVKLVKHVRIEVDAFRQAAPTWPGVLALFHMGGADDYLLHVASRSAEDLRQFVLTYLAGHPAVAHTETNLIFEHVVCHGLGDLLA